MVTDATIIKPAAAAIPKSDPRGDGVLVKVRSGCGQEWLGTFLFGRLTKSGVSGLFTTPDPLCVVAAGESYFVSASRPTSWEEISAVPILDVHPITAHDIIVFADFTNLVADGETASSGEKNV